MLAPSSRWDVIQGDALALLAAMPADSVDAIVTDPPYGLSFMGKRWDYDVPSVDIWAECLRVLKPGGHLLAFAGTRTQHRMAVRIEDAGFEIRDLIAWVYGSGFPKSLDVSKAIDRAAGAQRDVIGTYQGTTNIGRAEDGKRGYGADGQPTAGTDRTVLVTAPATEAARQWAGWGTALKPALEPITVARKPLAGTVAENVQAHGTGALNIDGCRIESERPMGWGGGGTAMFGGGLSRIGGASRQTDSGRWPANLIHDGGDDTMAILGQEARFFYCPKASRADRNDGLGADFTEDMPRGLGAGDNAGGAGRGSLSQPRKNVHPTVKPVDLMRYLCRLITPPGGLVLDPFAGSGSTGVAALLEGFRFLGIERESEYCDIARARCEHAAAAGHQLSLLEMAP